MYDLLKMGQYCKDIRQNKRITQEQVANDLMMSQKSISRFEQGLNNNAAILLWYLDHGVNDIQLLEECYYE